MFAPSPESPGHRGLTLLMIRVWFKCTISHHILSCASRTEFMLRCHPQTHSLRSQAQLLKSLGVTLPGKARRKFSKRSPKSLPINHHQICDFWHSTLQKWRRLLKGRCIHTQNQYIKRQKSHLTDSEHEKMKSKWDAKIFYATYSSQRKGVVFLMSKDVSFHLLSLPADDKETCFRAARLNKVQIWVINCYVPNVNRLPLNVILM